MDRHNRYEAAFEAYLQWHRLCYVAVHEGRRAFVGERRVKNLDFIVHTHSGLGLLVDVKGRRFPSGGADKPRRIWECWSTQDDVDGLERWEGIFGQGYQGLLLFIYLLGQDEALPDNLGKHDLWTWQGQRYLLRGITMEDYRQHLRVRSPSWGTVHVPSSVFRQKARPFNFFMRDYQPSAQECPF
jgi:hypothetical protein